MHFNHVGNDYGRGLVAQRTHCPPESCRAAYLWVDAFLLSGAVFALCLAVAEGRPVLRSSCIHVNTVLVHKLDDFYAPVYAPEQRQVIALVDVIWVCPGPQQGFAALIAASAHIKMQDWNNRSNLLDLDSLHALMSTMICL